ncbi:hypothetical protein ASE74_06705 [Pedobacter sp. Leaf216]|uniref:hypothetical protein n=1 Tax=Pedobacter sp. Leaf216 TaxID=1735684 RepID=UPI0006FFB453|nr:hypothetical protein [Pedobacter sp. Leaf216]KQM67151.1 hypothetical protein ASE74_06705 [Pedobacter sp. Leaf216]
MSKQTVGWIVGVFVLFPLFVFLYNKITVRKNDGAKYLNLYIGKISKIDLQIPVSDINSPIYMKTDFDHYRRGASGIGFKGLSGEIQYITFFETIESKYFRIYLFDTNYQSYANFESVIEKKKITGWVNQDDLKDPSYGTKERPIPIFTFKGINEPIRITSESEGSVNGYESLEPTYQQYKHNVLTYLTYIMPKEEFQERFEKK